MADSPNEPSSKSGTTRRLLRAAPVIVVGSVMFSFISYWRVAAVVLCDMASTAFYIGGIAEQMIGPAAPWFIGCVMLFCFAVGSVYIESCSMFVRGGVYRVVKEALGGLPAKAAVSALLFDYILTGPISSVTAGQYFLGWVLEFIAVLNPALKVEDEGTRYAIRSVGSVIIAVGITLYFFWKNLIGIHESSGKALRIMLFTTAVGVIVLGWSGLTLALRGPVNTVPKLPDLSKKVEYETVTAPDRVTGDVREMWQRDENGRLVPQRDEQGQPKPKLDLITGRQSDPLGFLPHIAPEFAEKLRAPGGLWTLFGIVGLIVAFGHSILAMSGEETMAQVYREVESPKLPNFKKAAFVIFTYATILTTSVSFLAVLLVPDEVRMKDYAENLLGGLSMYVIGPAWARLILNALVVVAGFLILSGAVNTSIIGSNGVLNRVAEDGVLPDKLLKPHPKYGTTHRILYLVVGLQLFAIVASGGNTILLGEAYAFGVVWSFFFKALSMLVLRFHNVGVREYKVPLNIPLGGGLEIPVGMSLIFVVLALSAISNLITKEVATVSGLGFSAAFLTVFLVTERYTVKGRAGAAHEHLEQFSEQSTSQVSMATVDSTKPYRKLVAIRSPQNLYMLERALEETDPETTDVIVMTAKVPPPGEADVEKVELDRYDRKLITTVIEKAEKVGKKIKPLVVPTNNPLFAVINTAKSLAVQELIVGASNKYTAEEQLDQMAFYWINQHEGQAAPLTIRVLSRTLDVHFDVAGGARIPKISERKARTVGELRAAGVGVRRALLVHDATGHSSDVFDEVLTMLDPDVALDFAHLPNPADPEPSPESNEMLQDVDLARQLGREVEVHELTADPGTEIVRLAREKSYDVILLNFPQEHEEDAVPLDWTEYVRQHSPCPVLFVSLPAIPREVGEDEKPST